MYLAAQALGKLSRRLGIPKLQKIPSSHGLPKGDIVRQLLQPAVDEPNRRIKNLSPINIGRRRPDAFVARRCRCRRVYRPQEPQRRNTVCAGHKTVKINVVRYQRQNKRHQVLLCHLRLGHYGATAYAAAPFRFQRDRPRLGAALPCSRRLRWTSRSQLGFALSRSGSGLVITKYLAAS